MKPGLTASFTRRFAAGPVIRIDDLRAPDESGITVLFGASGSGKTTVLRCLAGLERPDTGLISFGDQVWCDSRRRHFLAPRQRQVGFVPQDYALFPHLNVAGNVAYGLNRLSTRDRQTRVAQTIGWLGLSGLEARLPRELSGGQQQRVALARALAPRPRLLLLDEPLSALDAPTRMRLRGELRGLLRQLQIPTLLVTHDRQEALTLADQLVILHEGSVIQQGPVQAVFSRPHSLAAAGILAVETIAPGTILAINDGLAAVAVNGRELTALADELATGAKSVFVCIRAEDVILSLAGDGPNSPRNRLAGAVRCLLREGPLVRVDVDCGFPLMALLTKQACHDLDLREGTEVLALIKAPHIHLIPRFD